MRQLAEQLRCKPEDLWGTVAEAADAWRDRRAKLAPRRAPAREEAAGALGESDATLALKARINEVAV